MIQIRSYNDILIFKKNNSSILSDLLLDDLFLCYKENEDNYEVPFAEFNAEESGNGYIVLLSGYESDEELNSIGLTNGYDDLVPEGPIQEHNIDGVKWTRIISCYCNTCSMIFYLRNTYIFDSYKQEELETFIDPPF